VKRVLWLRLASEHGAGPGLRLRTWQRRNNPRVASVVWVRVRRGSPSVTTSKSAARTPAAGLRTAPSTWCCPTCSRRSGPGQREAGDATAVAGELCPASTILTGKS